MNSNIGFARTRNGVAIPRQAVPAIPLLEFRRAVIEAVANGGRLSALFGALDESSATLELYAVIADSLRGQFHVARTRLETDHYPALTPECPQAHLFERELAEQFGVCPKDHPWFKPVRFHASYRPGHDAWNRPAGMAPVVGVTDFYRVEGEEVHEVAVGPVHAGVIEPGHFRFQCYGEQVFHLEISLGYQHRGAERSLIGGPNKRTIHTLETVAGDTTVGHATAYCQVVEALANSHVPARGEVLRGIALELERLANHTGDLGALAGDVAYLPTAAYCGRLRGDWLNATGLWCGNRFGRSAIVPGGVRFDVDETMIGQLKERVTAALNDLTLAADLLFDSASVQARFESCGRVSPADAVALGLVGPAARACGLECDVRDEFPWGIFRFTQIPVSTWATGDVFARAYVRWLEIQRSAAFIRNQLNAFPDGPVKASVGSLRPHHLVVSLVEGWRGEICHVALTDAQARFARYKIVDPSFHNWNGLAMSLRDQQISDFPLCNKSFNLSYCGHDL